jgi:Family of unknown function (DUF6151)
MDHPLRCQCGTLKGTVSLSQGVNRAVCYCRDCQAFAHFLGRASETLDAQGGTDVIQTLPARLTFTAGREVLACVRLSDKGLVRWYAECCRTPIGNTLIDYRISFIGLVHTCLQTPEKSLDSSFGPVRMRAFTKSAKGGGVKSTPLAMVPGILRLIGMVGRARITGAYKHTPLFSPDTGIPIATPKILSAAERAAVYEKV